MTDLFAPLTDAEADTLRRTLYRGSAAAYKLAVFTADDKRLWERAQFTAREIAGLHADLCER